MVDENLVSEILALYGELSDPALRGLVGMMKITKLKKLLKQIEKAGLLDQVVSIRQDRIAEIRESNLIAAASHAWSKSQDKELSVEYRLKQLDYVEHHMAKAGCGWQVLQLTEKNFITLKMGLMCERIERTSADIYEAQHYCEEALRFVRKLDRTETISKDQSSKFFDTIYNAYSAAAMRIKNNALHQVASIIQSLTETNSSPEDTLKQLYEAQFVLRNADIQGRDSGGLNKQIRELENRAELKKLSNQVEALMRDGKGIAAYDTIEQIGNELNDARWTWADLGFAEESIVTQKLTWAYESICVHQGEAEKLLAAGDDKAALQAMQPVSYLLEENYEAIGKDISGVHVLLKTLRLFANFRYTLSEMVEPGWAFTKMGEAVAALQDAGFSPANIDPTWTTPIVAQLRRDLGLRGVERELTRLMERDSAPSIWIENQLSSASKMLTEIGANWNDVPNIMAIREFVKSNGVAFPKPG